MSKYLLINDVHLTNDNSYPASCDAILLAEPSASWVIYAHFCSCSISNFRYVGLTTQTLRLRSGSHVRSIFTKTKHHDWLKKHLSHGIHAIVLEHIPDQVNRFDKLQRAEQQWIAKLKSQGHDLTNLTIGGEGTQGYRPTAESNLKRSSKLKARGRSVEHEINRIAALAGRKIPALSGSKNHKAKLTQELADSMRKDYSSGIITYFMLGELYGVSAITAKRVIKKDSWNV